MTTAKIVRIRHRTEKFKNDERVDIDIQDEFKIVFSNPSEMKLFKDWIEKEGGKYDFDKETGFQLGEMPKPKIFEGEDICWCDLMSYYLLHVQGYKFHSAILPYKGEIYYRD